MPNCVRIIASDNTVRTVAGTCDTPGYQDGPAPSALFNNLVGIAIDAAGNIFVADGGNYVVRRISTIGMVSTVAGTPGSQAVGGPYDPSRFIGPGPLAFGTDGTLYVGDTYIPPFEGLATSGAAIRTVDATGTITTIAGGSSLGHVDDVGAKAVFFGIAGFAVSPNGHMLITDGRCIRDMAPNLQVITVSGWCGFGELPASTARYVFPSGIATDRAGNVYVVDSDTDTIQQLLTDGSTRTVAGVMNAHGSNDGTGPVARFHTPYGIAITPESGFFITDYSNDTIRQAIVTTDGDTNGDSVINAADMFYLIRYLFAGGPSPIGSGDTNHDSKITAGDVFYFINYLFANGSAP